MNRAFWKFFLLTSTGIHVINSDVMKVIRTLFPSRNFNFVIFFHNTLIKLVFIRYFPSIVLTLTMPTTVNPNLFLQLYFLKIDHNLNFYFCDARSDQRASFYSMQPTTILVLNTTCRSTLTLLSCLRYFYTSLFPFPT